MSGNSARTCVMRAIEPATVAPLSSARRWDFWIVGPSATGSENGTPNSRASAPAAMTVRIISKDSSGPGSPSIMKGTNAPS